MAWRWGRGARASVREGLVDQFLLLELVAARRAGGRAGRRAAREARERMAREQPVAEAHAQRAPRAHVLGFFLHPEDRRVGPVLLEQGLQVLLAERVELLEPQDRD